MCNFTVSFWIFLNDALAAAAPPQQKRAVWRKGLQTAGSAQVCIASPENKVHFAMELPGGATQILRSSKASLASAPSGTALRRAEQRCRAW
jgi:hypothetical protein